MIGIFGGSFDPVHYGHLQAAIDVRRELDLSEIRFIPAGVTTHREQPVATAEQRQAMLLLATGSVHGLSVDDREIKRAGPSYMIDTIRSLKADLPDETFCLILGLDAFLNLESWREWKLIIKLVNVVVTTRPGFSLQDISDPELKNYINTARTDKKKDLQDTYSKYCFFCSVAQLDISSTKIRQRCKENLSLHDMLPAAVVTYLMHNGIYQ